MAFHLPNSPIFPHSKFFPRMVYVHALIDLLVSFNHHTHVHIHIKTHTGSDKKPGLDSGLDYGVDELPYVNNLFAARITEFARASVARHYLLG